MHRLKKSCGHTAVRKDALRYTKVSLTAPISRYYFISTRGIGSKIPIRVTIGCFGKDGGPGI
jgi:hypothetical protein